MGSFALILDVKSVVCCNCALLKNWINIWGDILGKNLSHKIKTKNVVKD